MSAFSLDGLAKKKCVPCEGGVPALTMAEARERARPLKDWQLNEAGVIVREYRMKHFMAAVEFIQKIAEVAESENHHPNLHLTGYRNLKIELTTHAIGGLSENDFIVAAKIEQINTVSG